MSPDNLNKKGSGLKTFAPLRKYVKYPCLCKDFKRIMYGANGPGDWASGTSLILDRTTASQFCQMVPSPESIAFSFGNQEERIVVLYEHSWKMGKPQKRFYRQLPINIGYNHDHGSILLSLGLHHEQKHLWEGKAEDTFPPMFNYSFNWGSAMHHALCPWARTAGINKQSLPGTSYICGE